MGSDLAPRHKLDDVTITDIEMSGDVQMAWDQQAGETGLQYKKFRTYLEMEREERTVRASFRRYGELNAGKEGAVIGAIAQWQELSVAQRWMDRARAYDRWVDVKVMEKLANQRLKSLAEIADLGSKLRRTAAKALESLRTTIKEESIDPETNESSFITRSTLGASDIAKLAQVGMEMEQLAIGAPTSRNSIVPASDDSTLGSMADAKAILMKKVQEIAARRAEATQHQLDNPDRDSAGESIADATIESMPASNTLYPSERGNMLVGSMGDADYVIEIDSETASPEERRLEKIRKGEL